MVQKVAEKPALNALLGSLESPNEMVRIRAAEVLLAYARGKPGPVPELPAVDPAVEAAEQERLDQQLFQKLKRMEATLKDPLYGQGPPGPSQSASA